MCSCDFEVNQTNIKDGYDSGSKVVTHDSKSDLPLHKLYVNFNFPQSYHCVMAILLRNQVNRGSAELDCYAMKSRLEDFARFSFASPFQHKSSLASLKLEGE